MKTTALIIGLVCVILILAGYILLSGKDTPVGKIITPFTEPPKPEITVEIQNVRNEQSDGDILYGLNPIVNLGYDVYIRNIGTGRTSWVSISLSVIDSEGNILDTQTIETQSIAPGGYIRKHMVWKRSLTDLGYQVIGVWKDEDYRFHIKIEDVNWEGKEYD